MAEEILTALNEADLVLVGLGEEFDEIGEFHKEESYLAGRTYFEKEGQLWLMPKYDEICRQKYCAEQQKKLVEGLARLAELLEEKNYFVLSTAMNEAICETPWKEGRLVSPCGGTGHKQCVDGCEAGLGAATEADAKSVADYIHSVCEKGDCIERDKPNLGVCPNCGKPLIYNNIYAEHYDEKGYLLNWQRYTKWLQGTLNKKLVILELGVGMKFPSVIRWPFEKVAYFNNKAHIYRINKKLYQLSEELKGKGTPIQKNSIDWLISL